MIYILQYKIWITTHIYTKIYEYLKHPNIRTSNTGIAKLVPVSIEYEYTVYTGTSTSTTISTSEVAIRWAHTVLVLYR